MIILPSKLLELIECSPLTNNEERFVFNLAAKSCEDNPQGTLDEVTGLVAGISKASIHRARKENETDGKLVNPKKTRKETHLAL
jgi:hypothetical protein